MISHTRLMLPLVLGLSATVLAACGGGGSESTSSPSATAPNVVVVAQPVVQKGCAGRVTAATVDQAISIGRADLVNTTDLIEDITGQITCSVEDADVVIGAFFGLDSDFKTTADSLPPISWDPTHDAAILTASADSVVLLRSNAVTRSDRDVQSLALAIAGEKSAARHLVLGSNPMRNIYRGGQTEGMTSFLKNGMSWLTKRDDLSNGELSVVIAQMSQSYYFPDQVAVREWLDTEFDTGVTYNDAGGCDGAALRGCLNALPDLLILSQTGDEQSVGETASAALDAGIPILYMHHDGGLTSLGAELLPLLGAHYAGDNYWRNLSIESYDGTLSIGMKSAEDQSLEKLLTQIENESISFDFTDCDDKSCPSDHSYTTEYLPTLEGLKTRFDAFDSASSDLFLQDGQRRDKALVLLADKFRENIAFPMDKNATSEGEFLQSLFADHIVHTARAISPVQTDMGNFSRSDFSHVSPVTKSVTLSARKDYSAAGLYAIPGKTVRVKRMDNSDVNTHIRINLLRSGATHEFSDNGYSRPKHLSSPDMPIGSGETLSFTSPYGGPIQIRFDGSGIETEFIFENVGEHAVWRGPEDDESFEARLGAGDYDWAELITPGFQVHSKLEKMRDTVNHPIWPSAAQVAEATQRHLHNLPHVLAGLKGDGIDVVPEIHDFATENDLDVHSLSTVKHMNADQATCGYGCSGNPYDAYWDFNPIGHGDIHELGHGLERSRFLYAGQPGHAGTNPYSYFSKSVFYQETGNTSELGCQNLPYEALFTTIQESRKQSDPSQFMRDQALTAWSQGAAINLQIMMGAEDLGLLSNGYYLLARQHIIDREFNLADNSDAEWEEKKDGLGFGSFTREAARNLSNNDWNLIAVSHALDRDLSDYLEFWGFELSDFAKTAVEDKIDFPTNYYIADSDAHCIGFPTEKLPIDGEQSWPITSKPIQKSKVDFHHHTD